MGVTKKGPSPSVEETFFARLVSIRVVLVTITILTVACLAVGLIFLNVQAQNSIVNSLSHKILDGVSEKITDEIGSLLEFIDTEAKLSKRFLLIENNITSPANNTNIFLSLNTVAEQLMNIVTKRPEGIVVELSFPGGNTIGIESYSGIGDLYLNNWIAPELFSSTIWPLDLSQTLASVNYSLDNSLFYIEVNTTDPVAIHAADIGLIACDSPSYWLDLAFFAYDATNSYILMGEMNTACNSEGKLVGYTGVHLGLQSITSVLKNITQNFAGKIFIMDDSQQLVATSTDSPIFSMDFSAEVPTPPVRHAANLTDEVWIKDVAGRLGENFATRKIETSFNGTEYFLSVTYYNFATINWVIVTLLEREQFLGDYRYYFINSIVTTAVISAISLAFVLIVTWMTTKPLFMLAVELRKMSQLDLDISDLGTPRLLEVGRLYHSVVSMYIALRSFKKFVPVSIISNIIKTKKEATLVLAPEEVTVMFQDIEGFTSLSELVDPMTLARLTGEYMECMTEIICKHGGTIDKYIGDCIMSIFNAPEPLADHSIAAVAAATECQAALEKKNVEWAEKYGKGLACRFGINTGKVLVGNLGSELRMNYTVIGDNVNIAARLEGVNKMFGTRIMISKSVYANCPHGKFITRKLSKVRVSGKAEATTIYEVRPPGNPAVPQLFSCYEFALRHFKHRDFESALNTLSKCLELVPGDKPSLLLIERIEELQACPLSPTWSYVDNLLKM